MGRSHAHDKTYELMCTGAAIAAGIAVRSALKAGYEYATGHAPPENPASRDVSWKSALLWSALAGAAVGIARTMGRRGATAGWERFADSRSSVVH